MRFRGRRYRAGIRDSSELMAVYPGGIRPDRLQRDGPNDWNYADSANYPGNVYFEQKFQGDEPFVDVIPFLAVFDDDEVREIYDTTQWLNPPNSDAAQNRLDDLTEYITQKADRMHFNRYTGVVMK